MTPELFDPLSKAAARITTLTGADLTDYMALIALESGGSIKPALPGNNWDNQRWELTAFGVFAEGDSPEDCARNWQRCARAEVEAMAVLFDALRDLHEPGGVEPDQLIASCETVIDIAAIPADVRAARAMLQKMGVAA